MNHHVLQPFLTPKSFRSSFDLAGLMFDVEVETPDLSGCSSTMWGDWGPMYELAFAEGGRVRITYRCEELSFESRHDVWLSKMELLSPMSWAQRRDTPFQLVFRDWQRGIGFKGFLAEDGVPTVLHAIPLASDEEVMGMLVRDSATVRPMVNESEQHVAFA